MQLFQSNFSPNLREMSLSVVGASGEIMAGQNWGGDFKSPRWAPWTNAISSDPGYPMFRGQESARKDFSETLGLYYVVRSTPEEQRLRELMPGRFSILDKLKQCGRWDVSPEDRFFQRITRSDPSRSIQTILIFGQLEPWLDRHLDFPKRSGLAHRSLLHSMVCPARFSLSPTATDGTNPLSFDPRSFPWTQNKF